MSNQCDSFSLPLCCLYTTSEAILERNVLTLASIALGRAIRAGIAAASYDFVMFYEADLS